MTPSLFAIINRKEKLRTNSGKEVDELTFAPFKITPDDVSVQDGGLAVIIEINTDRESDNGIFLRFHSSDSAMEHEFIRAFIGKRVEVTIKVLPE